MKVDRGTPLILHTVQEPSKGLESAFKLLNITSSKFVSERDCCSISEELQKTTELLRQQLVQLTLERGSFLNDDVIKLSQWLDQYIVVIQNYSALTGKGYLSRQ
ncbi:aspartyl-phosphate phosphatase Spo0E family protein [Brevibacillus humidisoli]|uniref:aspartyl-phosphate phosphatase Spo0E family protein n=1 Tax=Brevibacillus humidisoli TaxID=2895522 RepID=UPI001E54284B|nr:aspartyl-phosphate phosphatase Spo0E family protein [Brevibacillus humidisoli]UFJ41485.1 aspartyl-phosphate phosphatase Spo0E family protein [Brevibacillus humidisoli]